MSWFFYGGSGDPPSYPKKREDMLYCFNERKPEIGAKSYVSELAHVIGDVRIGDNCYIGHGVILRGDYGSITIESGTAIEEGVIVHAPPENTYVIGQKVTVGHGAIIHGSRIGDYAVIGMGAILSLRSEVGQWAIIGEGCVVKMMQKIPDRMVAVGNPAKIVREINAKDQELWNYAKQLYIDLAQKYLSLGMQPID